MNVRGCRGKHVKVSVFVFNLISWILGFVLIGLGAFFVASDQRQLIEYLLTPSRQYLLLASGILIGVGCFIIVVSFIGCFGTIVENRLACIVYIILLLLIVGTAIAVLVYAVPKRQELQQALRDDAYENLLVLYPPGNIIPAGVQKRFGDAVNYFQQEGQCCGINNFTDWKASMWYLEAQDKTNNFTVPRTCCMEAKALNDISYYNEVCLKGTNFYKKGCFLYFEEKINYYAPIFIGIAVTIIVLKVVGIVFTILLTISINKEASYGY